MQDPLGIVPPDIRAHYERAEFVDRAAKAGRALAAELKGIYGPQLDVVFVRPGPDLPESCVPWRWHVCVQPQPPAVAHYYPILGPGGSYREPDFGVVNELAEIDLRRPEVMKKMLERSRTDQPHKQGERDLRKEQRRDVMASDYKAARRVRGEGGLKRSFEAKRKMKKAA